MVSGRFLASIVAVWSRPNGRVHRALREAM
jgi:hypothetical protein